MKTSIPTLYSISYVQRKSKQIVQQARRTPLGKRLDDTLLIENESPKMNTYRSNINQLESSVDKADFTWIAATNHASINAKNQATDHSRVGLGKVEGPEQNIPYQKYKTTSLTAEQRVYYANELLLLMEQGRPYLDSGLSLSTLAKCMNIPSHHLSQIINAQLGVNFNDFVNNYRIEESKKHLINDLEYNINITQIMYESGFNSKSVFNKIFKKKLDMTPSEFRIQNRGQKGGTRFKIEEEF